MKLKSIANNVTGAKLKSVIYREEIKLQMNVAYFLKQVLQVKKGNAKVKIYLLEVGIFLVSIPF